VRILMEVPAIGLKMKDLVQFENFVIEGNESGVLLETDPKYAFIPILGFQQACIIPY